MTHSKKFTSKIIFIIFLMNLALGFGIDLYSPSFPSIASSLQTSNQFVQLTISTYFFGYAFGLLLLGPTADTFGRKKPLVFGLFFYCLISLLCSFSTSIKMLLILRFFQGMGISAIGVMFRSILSDVFEGQQFAKAMSYASMSYRLGPIMAPLLGGYLDVFFGWRSNFYFLTLYGLLIVSIIMFFLPETHFERFPFHPKVIVKRYLSILKNLSFLGGALCVGIFYGMMIIFNVVGPFFIQDILNYSPITFGHIAFLLGISAFLGMFLNRVFLNYQSVDKIVLLGMYFSLFLCIIQTIFAIFFPINLYSFVIPVGLVLFISGFTNSNIMSQSMSLIPSGKGTASALFAILLILTTTILTFLSSFLKSNTIRPFAFAYLGMVFLCFLSYQFLFKRQTPTTLK